MVDKDLKLCIPQFDMTIPMNSKVAQRIIIEEVEDPDDVFYTLEKHPLYGTCIIDEHGLFTYLPDTNYVGLDEFDVNVKFKCTCVGNCHVKLLIEPYEPPQPPQPSEQSGTSYMEHTTDIFLPFASNRLTLDHVDLDYRLEDVHYIPPTDRTLPLLFITGYANYQVFYYLFKHYYRNSPQGSLRTLPVSSLEKEKSCHGRLRKRETSEYFTTYMKLPKDFDEKHIPTKEEVTIQLLYQHAEINKDNQLQVSSMTALYLEINEDKSIQKM